MTGWRARVAAVILAIIASMAGAAVASPPAAAAALPMGDCTTTSGVVVVVDFAHWGGPVLRSCGSTPTTGYTLLNQGGWDTAGTEHDGPGFICRIGYAGYDGGTQYPTAAQEPCVLTPPASAYWAFWYAGPGQDAWNYSQAGAMSYHPAPGSVELWNFGGTSLNGGSGSAVPTFSPASVRARNAAPPGAGRPTSAAARTSPGPAAPAAPAATSAAASPRSSAPAAAGARPTGSPTVRDAPPAVATTPVSHGSPAPAIIALVIVLLLAAAGITAAARRPRRER
jgi:hypothetical protein